MSVEAVTLTGLVDPVLGTGYQAWSGTEPLEGEWDVAWVLLCPDMSAGREEPRWGFGVRLASAVPGSRLTWVTAERLWYGDATKRYLGDGFFVPNRSEVFVKGPFRIQPRGRRVVVEFSSEGEDKQRMALTLGLERVA